MRTITINTDASFCAETGIAGYAIWIKTTEKTIQASGVFKQQMKSINIAECAAIVNALHLATTLPFKYDNICINTDNAGAKDYLQNQNRHNQFAKKFREYVKQLGVKTVRIKHVKAHSKTDDARSHINRWCYKQSRKEMRAKRKEIQKQTI